MTLTPCKFWKISQRDFFEHVSKHSGLLLILLRCLASKVREASARIGDLALYDVKGRLERVLCQLSTMSMLDGRPVKRVCNPPTHQEMASMIGASREGVTRALRLLEDQGRILQDDGQIWLHAAIQEAR